MARGDVAQLIQRFNTFVNGRLASRSLLLMHESGLTFPQIIVLYVLRAEGEQSVSRVAAVTRLSLPAASQMVDRLVESGYVSREEHASDRRIRVIALRPKGRRLVDEMNRVRHDELDEALTRLTPSLRSRLAEVLAAVVERLEGAQP